MGENPVKRDFYSLRALRRRVKLFEPFELKI
jgi:hypothetical protein